MPYSTPMEGVSAIFKLRQSTQALHPSQPPHPTQYHSPLPPPHPTIRSIQSPSQKRFDFKNRHRILCCHHIPNSSIPLQQLPQFHEIRMKSLTRVLQN